MRAKESSQNWIAGATKNKGALHRALHVAEDKKIPERKMKKALGSKNPKIKAEADLAKTLKSFHRK